jgi:hypothetical protein
MDAGETLQSWQDGLLTDAECLNTLLALHAQNPKGNGLLLIHAMAQTMYDAQIRDRRSWYHVENIHTGRRERNTPVLLMGEEEAKQFNRLLAPTPFKLKTNIPPPQEG